jgi:ribosomal protein L37E
MDMEVDPPKPVEVNGNSKAPTAHTGILIPEKLDRLPAQSSKRSIFCMMCGTRFDSGAEECPQCGFGVSGLLDEHPFDKQRPPSRELAPFRASLAVIGTILIPIGIVLMICAPIAVEMFRRERELRTILAFLFMIAGIGTEIAALVCFIVWLYQAWRLMLREDEDYSPGLMVGLLFVPFFNFYWVFRAVPGLSTGIEQEMRFLSPGRPRATGWGPGLAACILALIPPAWPVAICMYIAWALIANSALKRIVRYHAELQRLHRIEKRQLDLTNPER